MSLCYLNFPKLLTCKTSTHQVPCILSFMIMIHTFMLHHQTFFARRMLAHVSYTNLICTRYNYQGYLPSGSLKEIPLCLPGNFCSKVANCFHCFSVVAFFLLSQRFCIFSREGSRMHFLCRSGSQWAFLITLPEILSVLWIMQPSWIHVVNKICCFLPYSPLLVVHKLMSGNPILALSTQETVLQISMSCSLPFPGIWLRISQFPTMTLVMKKIFLLYMMILMMKVLLATSCRFGRMTPPCLRSILLPICCGHINSWFIWCSLWIPQQWVTSFNIFSEGEGSGWPLANSKEETTCANDSVWWDSDMGIQVLLTSTAMYFVMSRFAPKSLSLIRSKVSWILIPSSQMWRSCFFPAPSVLWKLHTTSVHMSRSRPDQNCIFKDKNDPNCNPFATPDSAVISDIDTGMSYLKTYDQLVKNEEKVMLLRLLPLDPVVLCYGLMEQYVRKTPLAMRVLSLINTFPVLQRNSATNDCTAPRGYATKDVSDAAWRLNEYHM